MKRFFGLAGAIIGATLLALLIAEIGILFFNALTTK